MPTDIWSLPKDPSTGAVRGSYYLRHETPGTTATLGFVQFEDGRSVRALTGRELVQFVGALGRYVDLEPADDEARAALGVTAQATESVAETEQADDPEIEVDASADPDTAGGDSNTESESESEPEPAADDLDALELDELRALAAAEGIEGAERRGKPRLLREIRAARASADPDAAGA